MYTQSLTLAELLSISLLIILFISNKEMKQQSLLIISVRMVWQAHRQSWAELTGVQLKIHTLCRMSEGRYLLHASYHVLYSRFNKNQHQLLARLLDIRAVNRLWLNRLIDWLLSGWSIIAILSINGWIMWSPYCGESL